MYEMTFLPSLNFEFLSIYMLQNNFTFFDYLPKHLRYYIFSQ